MSEREERTTSPRRPLLPGHMCTTYKDLKSKSFRKREWSSSLPFIFSRTKTWQNRYWIRLLNPIKNYEQAFWTGLRVRTHSCSRRPCRGNIWASDSPAYSRWAKSRATYAFVLQMMQNISPLMVLILELGLVAETAVSAFFWSLKQLVPLRDSRVMLNMSRGWCCTQLLQQ